MAAQVRQVDQALRQDPFLLNPAERRHEIGASATLGRQPNGFGRAELFHGLYGCVTVDDADQFGLGFLVDGRDFSGELLQRFPFDGPEHQGPVLGRASELFSRLTLGDHSGLTTGFGNDDRPVLVAIRRNGEHVEIEGLSDGTRDQLYLALRLAAIEHHVETVAPCPVILDDILVNSDDARASAALQVIGDLAEHTQVLFFTRHRRLAELGVNAGAQMIELEPAAAATV